MASADPKSRALRLVVAARGGGEALAVGRSNAPLEGGGVRARWRTRPPRVGELAVFAEGPLWVVHRLVWRWRGRAWVRGDRPGLPLRELPAGEIIGTWEAGPRLEGWWRRPWPGRALALIGLLSSLWPVRPLARRARAWWPRRRVRGLGVWLGAGEAEALAIRLGRLGLPPRERSLSEVSERYLAGAGFVLFARAGGVDVGALRVVAQAEGGLIALRVARRAQGQGVGRRLLRRAVAEARARGLRELWAEIALSNPASIGLFEGEGFSWARGDAPVGPEGPQGRWRLEPPEGGGRPPAVSG